MGLTREFIYHAGTYDLSKTLESGQSFRFTKLSTQSPEPTVEYLVYDGEKRCRVSQDMLDIPFRPICLEASEQDIPYWMNYFDFKGEEEAFEEAKKIREIMGDPFLSEAYEFSKGIHLLHQDPWQVMVSFIISQRKSIPAIKTSIHRMCMDAGMVNWDDRFFMFPHPETLATVTDEDMRSYGLGYRAKYVSSAAKRVAEGFDLDSLKSTHCDSKTAYDTLLTFPGIGTKVANCIMLFGLGFRNVFPVDVWIERALSQWGKTQEQALELSGEYSGIVQQYIYYYMIHSKEREA